MVDHPDPARVRVIDQRLANDLQVHHLPLGILAFEFGNFVDMLSGEEADDLLGVVHGAALHARRLLQQVCRVGVADHQVVRSEIDLVNYLYMDLT